MIRGGHAVNASYAGFEMAHSQGGEITGCMADCNDLSQMGIVLDLQNDLGPVAGGTVRDCVVKQPRVAGVLVIGSQPDAGGWRSTRATVRDVAVTMRGSRADASGIRVQNLSQVTLGPGLSVDGMLAPRFNAFVIDGSRDVSLDGAEIRRVSSNAVQLIASHGKAVDAVRIGTIRSDGTGIPFQMLRLKGAFGPDLSFRCYKGGRFGDVANPGWQRLTDGGPRAGLGRGAQC